jgi:hypothetical protein
MAVMTGMQLSSQDPKKKWKRNKGMPPERDEMNAVSECKPEIGCGQGFTIKINSYASQNEYIPVGPDKVGKIKNFTGS